MIIPELHRKPVAINREKHGATVLQVPVKDWRPIAQMNAVFVTAAECVALAIEYPIVFIAAGKDEQGVVDYAPIAVLGLAKGENLFLDGGAWRAALLPGQLGMYPMCVARVDDQRYAVCIDEAWTGVAAGGPGERLFSEAGEPSEFTRRMQATLEQMEVQIDQTRAIGRRLADMGLLAQRRFDGTLPDGRKVAVDGFFMVDQDKVKALPDAQIGTLHRDGVLAMIHAHWISGGHMRKLLQWRFERETVHGAAAPSGTPTH